MNRSHRHGLGSSIMASYRYAPVVLVGVSLGPGDPVRQGNENVRIKELLLELEPGGGEVRLKDGMERT
jgi:hypothetical protein